MWQTTLYETSRLTLELRDIVDNGENSVDIWDFEYPSFYKDKEKKAFEQKVIDHFYFRQIGQETVGRFKHMFRTKVREIMPYYVQLYESQKLMQSIDDPFGNVDIVETFEQKSHDKTKGTSSTNGTVNEDNTVRTSDTPQGDISNLNSYLTGASQEDKKATSSGSGENNETRDGTLSHTYTKKGNQGVNTYAHDMKELRETFLNIDMMIINELNELFLGVY